MNNEIIVNVKAMIFSNLFLFLLCYRLLNSYLLKTIFEPDEIWQNIEPVNYFLLNKGELTWDWKVGIRSMNNVLIYYIPCFILKIVAPSKYHLYCFYIYKIMNAILAALLDFSTIKLYHLYHNNLDNILYITIFSHALWLYSPRSHINSLEMTIVIVSMYLYKIGNKKMATALAVYIGYLRPTSALLLFMNYLKDWKSIRSLLPCAFMTGLTLIGIDCIFYGDFVIPPLNFYYVNIQTSASDLFGKQPFYTYFIFLTILTGVLTVLAIKSFMIERKRIVLYEKMQKNNSKDTTVNSKIQKYRFYKELMFSIALFFIFYTSVPHKEMRFLLPLIPIINILAARMLNNRIRMLMQVQFLVSCFIGLTHQSYGETIEYLQKIDYKKDTNILYAVCPYSLPAYSFICHENVTIDVITGEKDIFTKFKPKFYKRFGSDVIVNHYERFINGEYKNFKFDRYSYVLLYDWSYKLMQNSLHNFDIVSRNRYCWINFESEKGDIIFILKNRLK